MARALAAQGDCEAGRVTLWDAFMLRDELDMLELRLEHMQDHDVQHVIVEAARTHRGEPKPLHYERNKERFARWRDRITHVVCELPPPGAEADPWRREHAQRDAARDYVVAHAAPGELVLIADVDEIPDMGHVAGIAPSQPVTLLQRIFAFAVDWEFPHEEYTSVLCPARLLGYSPLSFIRDRRSAYVGCPHSGWHFSWLGGNEAIRRKTAAHCHAEDDRVLLEGAAAGRLYEQGEGIWGFSLLPRDVDETWPPYIQQRRCPPSWFRPRKESQWSAPPSLTRPS